MEKKSSFLLLMFLLLFSISLVSAQPPFQQFTGNTGITIEASVIQTHTINQDFFFNIHAHNSSNGLLLTNVTTVCTIHIFQPSNGDHIYEDFMDFDINGIDFDKTILAGNFTELGQYSVLFNCEVSGEIGGFLSYGFDITKTGKALNESESQIYFILAFGVLILFALSFYFMIATEYGNEVNEKGAVIKVTKLKYVKLALILLTWVLFTWFLNILIGLSDNFVSLTMYYGFFGFIFTIMNNLAFPLGIFILVIALFEIIRDANIMENIKKFGSSYK